MTDLRNSTGLPAPPGEVLLQRPDGPVLRLWATARAAADATTLWPPSASNNLFMAMRPTARRFRVRFEGRPLTVETSGEGYCLMPAGSDAAFHGPSGEFVYALLGMPPAWLGALAAQHGLGAADGALPPRLGANKAPDMTALARILRHAHGTGAASPGFLDHWVMLAGLTALRDLKAAMPPPRGPLALPGDRLRRVTDYVQAMMEDEITLQDLAAVAGYSPWHFARAFRAATGMPPYAYVTQCRLERARALLQNARSGVAEVALACGFASQSHFTTAFRHAFGVPPAQWRRHQ